LFPAQTRAGFETAAAQVTILFGALQKSGVDQHATPFIAALLKTSSEGRLIHKS
jgi:hypothetical protein